MSGKLASWRQTTPVYGHFQEQQVSDLNRLTIPTDGAPLALGDYGASSADGMCEVAFRNLERRLCELIDEADHVVGCVAWLTSERILRSLAACKGVSIIVQKEDFLRPDLSSDGQWRESLRRLYRALSPTSRYWFDSRIGGMSVGGDPTLDAVRCVGNHNQDRRPAFPRMHHKFVVFCRGDENSGAWGGEGVRPYAVWTGSFNFTCNAGYSLENALILRDSAVVDAYFAEHGQIAALSEPLDWSWEWVAPEWRMGT